MVSIFFHGKLTIATLLDEKDNCATPALAVPGGNSVTDRWLKTGLCQKGLGHKMSSSNE